MPKKGKNVFKPGISHEKMLKLMEEKMRLHRERTPNLEFRKNLVEAQKRDNYVNEYQRLHGYITSHTIPTLEANRIKSRMDEIRNKTNEKANN